MARARSRARVGGLRTPRLIEIGGGALHPPRALSAEGLAFAGDGSEPWPVERSAFDPPTQRRQISPNGAMALRERVSAHGKEVRGDSHEAASKFKSDWSRTIPLRPGVIAALAALRHVGVNVAMCTNWGWEVAQTLSKLGLAYGGEVSSRRRASDGVSLLRPDLTPL